MKLSTNQKQQLLRLYNSSNDSFFTFLNSADYEKKMKKLSNAKDSYAFYAYDEEPLFLLDDTVFGSADNGFIITDKKIYINMFVEDPLTFEIASITQCSYVEEGTLSINYHEFTAIYLANSEQMVVNIINKLRGFYKENIIKEKNLNLYISITIPQSLSLSGGNYKDPKSGYTIPVSKTIKNGEVLSWEGYGKSYGDIKGKLTVTVYIEQPKQTPKPVYKQEAKQNIKKEPKKIIVDCVNCGKEHLNPTSNDCIFCGKSLTKKVKAKKKKLSELEVQMENDNSIDAEELELIVTCVNCSKDIKYYISNICPHCGEDVNIKKKKTVKKENKVKKVAEKTSSASEFYLDINDESTVKDIKNQFLKYTNLVLRVYESSRKQARSNKKLINLATKKSTIRVTTRMKIETIIEEFQEVGIKVRIASSDDSKLCNNNFTLAHAKEKDGE